MVIVDFIQLNIYRLLKKWENFSSNLFEKVSTVLFKQ